VLGETLLAGSMALERASEGVFNIVLVLIAPQFLALEGVAVLTVLCVIVRSWVTRTGSVTVP